MQLTQKHAFWCITRQNRSNSLSPSGANERTKNKKAQTIDISSVRGDHAPEPIDMPFSVLALVPSVIIPVKFYVDPLTVSDREHPKSAISYTFWNDRYNSSALPCRLLCATFNLLVIDYGVIIFVFLLMLCCWQSMVWCSVMERTFDLLWWTICFHHPFIFMLNMTWKAAHINGVRQAVNAASCHQRTKIWTLSSRMLTVCCWMLKHTMHSGRQ